MCTIISPFTLDQNSMSLMRIARSMEQVSKIIFEKTEPDDDLSGVANIIECLAENVKTMASEFESLKSWAEDVNIQIIHQRFHGTKIRLEVHKSDPQGPEVLLTSTKTKVNGAQP